MSIFVYTYHREDGSIYYVGKGLRDRVFTKHKRVRPPRDRSRIQMHEASSDEAALCIEIYAIHILGREDQGRGRLKNMTDGGEGAGNPSLELREKRRKQMTGNTNGRKNKGKKPAHSLKDWVIDNGPPRGMLGKRHTEESRLQCGLSGKETKLLRKINKALHGSMV